MHKIKLDEETSQRKLLCFVASIFDPLGIIAPFTIIFRKVLQAAWNHGPKWDKPLQLNENSDFENLKKDFSSFQDIHLPRKLLNEIPISSIELHTFTDASELAISAVSYLRIEHIDESISVAFVIDKARFAPIKRMTIPNLAFQAAVCCAHLAQFDEIIDENKMRWILKSKNKFFGLILQPFCIGYGQLRFVIGSSLLTD